MKRILIFLILFIIACFILGSCDNTTLKPTVKQTQIDYYFNKDGSTTWYAIELIDSCEYLVGQYGGTNFVTHKGNCKFCKQRKTNIK